jgi:hypothetical protein
MFCSKVPPNCSPQRCRGPPVTVHEFWGYVPLGVSLAGTMVSRFLRRTGFNRHKC